MCKGEFRGRRLLLNLQSGLQRRQFLHREWLPGCPDSVPSFLWIFLEVVRLSLKPCVQLIFCLWQAWFRLRLEHLFRQSGFVQEICKSVRYQRKADLKGVLLRRRLLLLVPECRLKYLLTEDGFPGNTLQEFWIFCRLFFLNRILLWILLSRLRVQNLCKVQRLLFRRRAGQELIRFQRFETVWERILHLFLSCFCMACERHFLRRRHF